MVGKKVMAAAADTLTPVTLELGGKDPVIFCEDINVEEVRAWPAAHTSIQKPVLDTRCCLACEILFSLFLFEVFVQCSAWWGLRHCLHLSFFFPSLSGTAPIRRFAVHGPL